MRQVEEKTTDSANGPRARHRATKELLDLLDAEHGPIGREAEEWAHRELARAQRELSSSTQER
jgi:hypothetical protein